MKVKRLFIRMVGRERLERILFWFARGVGIDLLKLGYRSVGVLKWNDLSVSGEKSLIERVRRQAIWSENPVLFDVGANTGDYSRALADAFPGGRIFAFEPNPNTFQILKRNLNGSKVNCIPTGLGSSAGTGALHVYPDDLITAHASRCAEVLTQLRGCTEPKRVPFTVTTLDSFCEEHAIARIDLLKIDTEGYELDVLKGARKMLERDRIGMIQFEFGDCDLYTRVFLRDFYDALPKYRFFRLNTDELIPLGAHRPAHEIFFFQNILAVDKSLGFPD